MSPKMGRPKADNPLNREVKVRIDDATFNRLEKYCKDNCTDKAKVIREAIIETVRKK